LLHVTGSIPVNAKTTEHYCNSLISQLQMFQTLTILYDVCAMNGTCSPSGSSLPTGNPVSQAAHSSPNGVYTAEQVTRYRQCSNDYSTKFLPKWDGAKWNPKAWEGYAPVGGNAKMESFRICWEPINAH
jgi:hypothetical protein